MRQSDTTTPLRAALERPLPDPLPADRATALFLYGHCFHPQRRVTGLRLVVAGRPQPPQAMRMPRPDLLAHLRATGQDAAGRSYRSGFWATVTVPAQPAGSLTISVTATLDDGTTPTAQLATIDIVAPDEVPAPALPPGTIAVCMATYEPDLTLFAEQIGSLRAQTDPRWVCVISDGGTSPERLSDMRRVLADDERFTIFPADGRLDPYRNFERALRLAPPAAQLLALCDQDDRWYPDKLAALRAGLGSAQLVYSDQRLVTAAGEVLRDSLWPGRRHDRRNLASLLMANTAPGAAMLLRRSVAERALPFPDAPGIPYHDHWLALAALAGGDLAYVDRPLYDYVQHAAAVQGRVARSGAAGPVAADPAGGGRQPAPSRGWRAAYFGGYVMRRVFAETLLARCGPEMAPPKRRALRRFAAAERTPTAFAWLALRPLRRFIGRDETLSGEVALVQGIVWRWLATLAVTGRTEPGRRPWDASIPDPPQFEQRRLRRWRAGGR